MADELYDVGIAVGGNVGEVREAFALALNILNHTSGIAVTAVSTFRETDPVGGIEGQPKYWNGLVIVKTSLSPEDLLTVCHQIECEAGRDRDVERATFGRNGPRPLDLDIIFYADKVVDTPTLRIPHPRFRERLFVLDPLVEVAPDWIDPETGQRTKSIREELLTKI